MIEPHGGELINRVLSEEGRSRVNIDSLYKFVISQEQIKDVQNIAHGVYSPLTGFLREQDYSRVLVEMRLVDGTVWPIPVYLDVKENDYQQLKSENSLVLVDKEHKPIALLEGIEFYPFNKTIHAKLIYGTLDRKHPGVDNIYRQGDYLVGGDIQLLETENDLFPEHNHYPEKMRQLFQFRGWNKIVAFQTRNVPHCGHEFLQKHALQQVDGLLIHPVIGQKKADDFADHTILTSYELLIEKYFPKNKVVLGILPLKMRYAGPKEAVFHALIRKNYGCTHFIVGRDHAGVGGYYQPFEAQEIFDQFEPDEIGIEILKYPEVVFDKYSQRHCFIHECEEKHRTNFSGSLLRKHIEEKTTPPHHMIRPEIYQFLTGADNSLIEKMQVDFNGGTKHKGFVIWMTGLSQSGKSTLADKLYEVLIQKGIKSERLDGDIIREYLARDLGFSPADRDENIRRVGFVAKLLARNGVAVISSFISPYKKQREELKIGIDNFLEMFIDTPLEICEKRDKKGVYAKARTGEIKNFTGISDPYEVPENPDLHIKTEEDDIKNHIDRTVQFLEEKNLI
jgi:sulfate adenylyltransferase